MKYLIETAVDWPETWRELANRLAADELTPTFLTEDAIRSATLRILQTQIDVVRQAEIEYPGRNLGGGQHDRLDLVVRDSATTTVVEFKYPREPRQTLPPWPDHFGSYLADTYRLGTLSAGGHVQRAVQLLVSGEAFLGYIERTVQRLRLGQYRPDDRSPSLLYLTPAVVAGLAPTTRKKIGRYEAHWEVTAHRAVTLPITGKGLWLAAYEVSATALSDSSMGT